MPLTTLSSGAGTRGFGAGLRKRYKAEVLADSPLGFWELADTSGTTVTDSSGNSRSLTYYNSPSLNQTGVSGNIPASVLFNGTTQLAYASPITGLNIASSANWSFEGWIKYTSTSLGGRGVGLNTHRWSGIDSSTLAEQTCTVRVNTDSVVGRISAIVVNSALSASITISWDGSLNDGNWHHVVVTSASGGAMTLYVDNVSRASSTAARAATTNARGMNIGGWGVPSPGPYDHFPGNVAAVAAYSSTLSTDRIQAHYLAGK